MTPPKNETLPQAPLEADKGIDKIKQDISQLKQEAQTLESKRSDFEKNKKTITKEESDIIKKEIEEEEKTLTTKKEELLMLIKKTKGALEVLKGNIESSTEKSQLESLEKEINAIQIKKQNILEKAREWGIENPKTAIASTAGIALLVRGVVNLFKKKEAKNQKEDKKEDKKEAKEKTEKEEKEIEKEEKPAKEKMPRRKKTLIGAGVIGGTAGVGVLGYKYWSEIKGWFLDLIGKNLTFDEAILKVKSDVGGVSESDLNIGLELGYIEEKKSITSYGEEIKIDKKRKRVEGLDMSFSNYEEMIHAANIINYSKASYRGKCVSDTPFYITSMGGDIEVRLLDDYQREVISGEGIQVGAIAGGVVGSIGALVAGYYLGPKAGATVGLGAIPAGIVLGHYVGDGRSTLAKICPKLADGIGKEKLLACLNGLPNLKQGDQERDPDNKSPLQKKVNQVIDEIEATKTDEDMEFDKHGNARNLKADVDPKDPTTYIIKSRGRLGQTKLKFIDGKIIKIEGLDIEFTDIKEGIMAANLTNKIRSEYAGKCTKNPFSYKSSRTTFRHPGLYASDGESSLSGFVPYRIISEETLQSRYPTLLKDIEALYIPYLHKMRSSDNRSLWIIPN